VGLDSCGGMSKRIVVAERELWFDEKERVSEWASERGFTSDQRKKVIYGRVKHGKRRS